MTVTKRIQIPPIQVTSEAWKDLEDRAEACGLTVTRYVRYRVYGKKVLTGEELERVRANEKLID